MIDLSKLTERAVELAQDEDRDGHQINITQARNLIGDFVRLLAAYPIWRVWGMLRRMRRP